jgi:hypothetical protein
MSKVEEIRSPRLSQYGEHEIGGNLVEKVMVKIIERLENLS